jgi:gamma-glutamylputrescine oxidase
VDADSLWQVGPTRTTADDGPLPGGADIVVVGGGLLGMCCAYWLARAGLQPLVIERGTLAAGATGRNSGLVIPTTAQPYHEAVRAHGPTVAATIRHLAVEGAELLAGMLDEGPRDRHEAPLPVSRRPTGLVQLALTEAQRDGFAAEVAASAGDGFEATWLDRDTLRQQIGTRLADDVLGGLHLPGWLTNSVAVVDAVAVAARSYGARVHQGVTVTAVRPSGTGTGVELTTSHGALRADTAILTTNAWLAELVPALRGVVRPVQGQLIATTPLPPTFPFGMAAQVSSGGEYWQQTPEGTVILGGCRTIVAPPDDPCAQRPQPEIHQALLAVLPRLFPDLPAVSAARGWAGAMAFTPDGLPIVDQIDASTWVVGGFNGHGMPFGASVGAHLADVVAGGARTPALQALRLDRASLGLPPQALPQAAAYGAVHA